VLYVVRLSIWIHISLTVCILGARSEGGEIRNAYKILVKESYRGINKLGRP
jgi:hypothetical protein